LPINSTATAAQEVGQNLLIRYSFNFWD
jgi:hypothetical protein